MKIALIGAGKIGTAIAAELSVSDKVTQIRVIDSHEGTFRNIEFIRSRKLRTFKADARDMPAMIRVLRGVDCVISCMPSGYFNPILAQIALRINAHFCDLGGTDSNIEEELGLKTEAEVRRKWVMPNCGIAPGLINLLGMQNFDQFDEAHQMQLRMGVVSTQPEPPFNFQLSYSAEKLLRDYTTPSQVLSDGRIHHVQPLSAAEIIHFGEPFNDMEAFHTSAGCSTLPNALKGKLQHYDYKTICYPGHSEKMQFLIGLGFAEEKLIDVQTHRTYRDILKQLMANRLQTNKPDAILMRVLVSGKIADQDKTLVSQLVLVRDEHSYFNAITQATAISASTIAQMLSSGKTPGGGASPPELVIDKADYFSRLKSRGLNISEHWFDGLLTLPEIDSLDADFVPAGG